MVQALDSLGKMALYDDVRNIIKISVTSAVKNMKFSHSFNSLWTGYLDDTQIRWLEARQMEGNHYGGTNLPAYNDKVTLNCLVF